MSQQPELLAVTQEDRDAAANLWLEFVGKPYSQHDQRVADEFRNGGRNDDEFVQAFARHRLQSTAALSEEDDWHAPDCAYLHYNGPCDCGYDDRTTFLGATPCVSSTDINAVCEQPEGVSVTTKAAFEDGPVAWMYPDDLIEMESNETSCTVYSVAMASPDRGRTIPLYAAPPELTALRAENEKLREALSEMLHSVCHETGFAAAVRNDSGLAYPWESLDLAEAKARAALDRKEVG